MHKMASDIEDRVGIKVLHIAEVTGEKVIEKGMKKIGLIGTKFTIERRFLQKSIKG
jgi:Aspartate racemase